MKLGDDGKYTDQEFPPDDSLLEYDRFWKRADEIAGLEDAVLFYEGVNPNDIQQGGAGDDFLMSKIAALAENSERVQKLFDVEQCNKGIWTVNLIVHGIPKKIVMDNYIPVEKDEDEIIVSMARNKGKELWVMILEKAFAKILGSYTAISADYFWSGWKEDTPCIDIYKTLCGTINDRFSFEGDDDLEENLVEFSQKKYVMDMQANDGDYDEFQIASYHHYSLLAARRVKDKSNNLVTICKLRNPWGRFEWKGDWSDESDCWTPELKEAVGHTVEEDGTFWISYQDIT